MKLITVFKMFYVIFFVTGITQGLCHAQAYGNVDSEKRESEFRWPEGKKAAISLSFDDGRASQVDNGIPIFNKYGIKATFYITPGNIKNRLEKWKEAAAYGHEIGNHTIVHPCSGNFPFARHKALEDYTLDKISLDIEEASIAIENIFGIRPSTFAYPCGQSFVGKGQNTKSYVPIIANNFIAGRGWLDEAPNDPSYCDLSKIYGMASDGYDFKYIKKLIDQTVESGGWLVLCGHEILPESGNLTTLTSMLDELSAYVSNPKNGIWVSTVKDVATYIKEQRGESLSPLYIYKDPSQSIDKRVDDLISRMTLEEKIGQLNIPCLFADEMGKDIPAKKETTKKFTKGTFVEGMGPGGGFFSMSDEILHHGPRYQAEFINELQRIAREETRLGIPLFIIEEGTHGFVASGSTIYPEGLAIGSTWNMNLVEDIYAASAKEARKVGAHKLYTLVIEPIRDPRLGRNQEAYSECTYLTSRIAERIVKGVQGDDISRPDKLIAGLAHYPGQSQAIGGLERGAMDISERTLREVFLPPWRAGIKAGALGAMATYPSIDGLPVHASKKILTDILRGELGFEGVVVSEGYGFATIVHEGIASTQKEAGAMAIKAGVDVGITFEPAYMVPMIENVREGKVHMDVVDRALKRILKLKFQMGLFENPYVSPDEAEKASHTPENQKLALQVAREGIVLLKNEKNLLPLNKNIRSIAVIGPNADDPRNQLGDYTSHVIPQEIVTVLKGVNNKVSPKTKVTYVKGCNVVGTNLNEIERARRAARNADVAIVVVGENERRAVDENGKNVGTNGESRDVANLDLTGMQEELIRAVQATGTPTIVVLINGRPLSTRWVSENVAAIVEAWIPGEKGGDAIADIIFGDYNPNGRLAITVPRHSGQLPAYYNHHPIKKQMSHYVKYQDMPTTPLYEFGFGLSYTDFEYSNLVIDQENEGIATDVFVSVEVQNIGKREGADVVQLYINDVVSSVVTPYIQLRGFEKIWLEPGEKKVVKFKLTPEELSFINFDMQPIVEPGEFRVMVGRSSADIKLEGSFFKKEVPSHLVY
jgi:beta-glucosidase